MAHDDRSPSVRRKVALLYLLGGAVFIVPLFVIHDHYGVQLGAAAQGALSAVLITSFVGVYRALTYTRPPSKEETECWWQLQRQKRLVVDSKFPEDVQTLKDLERELDRLEEIIGEAQALKLLRELSDKRKRGDPI